MTLTPRLTEPHLDPSYGITHAAPDASWPAIEEKLIASRNYWICTTRSNGAPHSKPVWGVWSDGLWFSTGANAVTGRNLARDPRVSVHLESGDDVVILEGSVDAMSIGDIPQEATRAYEQKYDFDPTGDEAPDGTWYRLVPSLAHTWLEDDFVNSVGRWEFD
ncbi:MAG: pyridoxamine 5'-phosphate oxidase family protein [Dehalococcoidia bacterium]|nr:pyridoxamine 5'-phosphate oxidase family protein [Dehalococcoidia bacterium]